MIKSTPFPIGAALVVVLSITSPVRSGSYSFTDLGDLPGGDFDSYAEGVSADGSVIVGVGTSDAGKEAFLWDATNGMRSLPDLLTANGVDLTGWNLSAAYGLSPNGRFIVGIGTNPSGDIEAWLASVPEPSTYILWVIAFIFIGISAGCRKARKHQSA